MKETSFVTLTPADPSTSLATTKFIEKRGHLIQMEIFSHVFSFAHDCMHVRVNLKEINQNQIGQFSTNWATLGCLL
jgi:hypothetical protein